MQFLKKKSTIITLSIVILLLILGLVLGTLFGLFQRQEILDDYQLAYEVDGKLYEVFPIAISDVGVDKKGDDKDLYFRVNSYYNIEYLFRIAYGQYELNEPSTNKAYSGFLDYSGGGNAYVTEVDSYSTGNDIYASYSFHDIDGNEIYRYDPNDTATDEYIVRIKPTFFQGLKKSERSTDDDFVNITQLFKDKLNKKVTTKVDEKDKMLIFSITDLS
ncbi:hypothetical protein [Listeria costaricensis]|uniref:hypothetical protein n=1 Tax=Listeria costaricensis TaxID=2026604 RepID=UPI000C0779C8|nr:hypothetical protein [Listeria costaricensis]